MLSTLFQILYTIFMLILGIETSCDETAVAFVETRKSGFFVIDEIVSSQIKTHAPFGGVVPNLAAREHVKNLPILLKRIFAKNRISGKNIDLISVTHGPGLIPALLVGTNSAKALAYAWKKPLVGVNHVAGHIYANFIHPVKLRRSRTRFAGFNRVKFPVLALVVSGGHTSLVLMKKHLHYKIIGQTLDDAAGEAFDKAAKILGLGYPGGPAVAALAAKFPISNFQFPNKSQNSKYQILDTKYQLPRPMINSGNFNFSFSGLKTALLYTVRDNPKILKSKKLVQEVCAEFQQAIVDVLVHKTILAAKKYKPRTILLGGGVSANKHLRIQLKNAIIKNIPDTRCRIPDTRYSLDNAAMIAALGYYKYKAAKNPPKARLAKNGKKTFLNNWKNLEADANLKL
jgi:N6-L-threonylcarbamoyladenine synthase